jgi:hypothetical protein
MMKAIEGRTFQGLRDRAGSCDINDTEFRRCVFRDCVTSTHDVQNRPRIRNVKVIDCEESNCDLQEAMLEDVIVDGLRVKDLFIISDCAYKHVTLRGNLGRLKITSGFAGLAKKLPKLQAALNDANSAYYANVDWALDISNAEFEDFSLSGVPLQLIRRDGETQVIFPASLAIGGDWRAVPEFAEVWGPRVDALLKVGRGPELLLVAAKRRKEFKAELGALNALRRSGLII